MFWCLVTASLPLRGNSEGHVAQSEPAEPLMRLWSSIAECVLFNLIKTPIAGSDIVNLPSKKEAPLPTWWSGIKTGNIFGFSVIYSQHSLKSLCWGAEPAVRSSGRDWGRWEPFGASSLLPSAWALQPGLCSSSALAGTQEGGLAPKQTHQCNLLAAITTEVLEKYPSPWAPGCWQQGREFRGASQGK